MLLCGAQSIQSRVWRDWGGWQCGRVHPRGWEGPASSPVPSIDKVWYLGRGHLDAPPYLTETIVSVMLRFWASSHTPGDKGGLKRGDWSRSAAQDAADRYWPPRLTKVPAKTRLDRAHHVGHARKLMNQVLKGMKWWSEELGFVDV